MERVAVARQPMVDGLGQAFAHELFYRRPGTLEAGDHDPDHMSAQVMVTTWIDLDHTEIAQGMPLFVNVGGQLLRTELLRLLDPREVVLEVAADAIRSPANRERVRAYAADGFRIALDHYEGATAQDELLDVVSYVKIDVRRHGPQRLGRLISLARASGVTPIATMIENEKLHFNARRAGFVLFQGTHLAEPELCEGRTVPVDPSSLLRLLLNHDDQMDATRWEDSVSRDAGLVYRLLRLARHDAPVECVADALRAIGTENFLAWTRLFALADQGPGVDPALARQAVVRAKTAAGLAPGRADAERCYLAGLVSAMAELLDAPAAAFADALPVSAEIRLAATGLGRLGPVVTRVERHGTSESLPEPEEDLARAYLDAMAWAEDEAAELAA
jgi:c-di-GMP-related signal transduction protein